LAILAEEVETIENAQLVQVFCDVLALDVSSRQSFLEDVKDNVVHVAEGHAGNVFSKVKVGEVFL